MLQPLSEDEVEFLEHFYTPTSLTECLFPDNFTAPQVWSNESEGFWIRPYNLVIQNFFNLYAEDPEKTYAENFKDREGAGTLYQIAARNTGKSLWLIIDTVLSVIYGFKQICIASCDDFHLGKVTDPFASYIDSHPFLKIFNLKDSRKKTVSRTPLEVITEHGVVVKGANEKAESIDAGKQFHGIHAESWYYEEYSYSCEEAAKKRIESGATYGCIERFSGIPDLRIGSPMTKTLNNKKLKNWTWRVPMYVTDDWCDEMKQQKIEKYGGENSPSYLLNVEAKIIEGAYGFWDMARIKEMCLKENKRIKYFEISKEAFQNFESIIHVERLPGTLQCFICADIGAGASPTEIIIIFFDGKKYKYVYNIPLFKLVQKEQAQIFKWLYDKLGGAFIALDNTGDHGGISTYLKDFGIPSELILDVNFNANIEVDFEKDENGIVIRDGNGVPLMKSVYTLDWSMSELEKLFYEGRIELPLDEKFLTQFNAYFVKKTGTRKSYGSSIDDHNHQAWQVFAICRFFNEFNMQRNNLTTTNRCYFVPFTGKK